MAAPYPKPDAERRNRAARPFTWTDLPSEGRPGKPPSLPRVRQWHAQTRKWWVEVWASPQASAWDQSGRTMVPFALVMDDLIAGRVDAVKASPEIRQHQDRHGMNPKAMLQLRWRVLDDEPEVEPVQQRSAGTSRAMRDRLSVVDGG